MRAMIFALALAACGGHEPAPAKPTPPTPKQLAAALDRDLVELAELASRTRGQCRALIGELGPLVARMRAHFDDVRAFQADPKLAGALEIEVAAYDLRAKGRSEQIGDDLGATYLACGVPCPAPVPAEPARPCAPSASQVELRRLIDQMPSV